MLAEFISNYKAGLSLAFAIIFSFTNLITRSDFVGTSVNTATSVLDFFTGTFHSIGQGFSRIVDSYGNYNELESERDALRKKLQDAQFLQFQTELLEDENRRLRAIIELPERKNYDMVTAEVISVDPDNWFQTIIINKGEADGIEVYMPVIAYQVVTVPSEDGKTMVEQLVHGVVGKVIQVTAHSARILPITDQHSRLGVKVKKTGHWGLLIGQSQDDRPPKLEYVTLKLNLEPGDEIVTSGAGGIFPPNVNIGVIEGEIKRGATFQEAYLRPAVDIRKLNFVLIVKKRPDDREKLTEPLSSPKVQKTLQEKISTEAMEEPETP
ncbi:MAG: rod shape-determining protein MreC [Leptospirales bacterium]